jgi:hypothetical protein
LADLLRGGALPSSGTEFGELEMFIGRNKSEGNNVGTLGCWDCAEKDNNVGDGKKQQRPMLLSTKWSTMAKRNRKPKAKVDENDESGNDENQYMLGPAPPSSSSSSLPPQQFETMTFSFAQMGSGGQVISSGYYLL